MIQHANLNTQEPTPEKISKLVTVVNDLFGVKQTSDGPRTNVKGRVGSLVGFAKPPPAEGQTMILMNLVFNGPEEEGKALFQPLFDIEPVVNQMRMDAYPECNKLIPGMYGLRSSMKGAAFMLPLRGQFVNDIKDAFEHFIDSCDDAAGTVIAWELYDPCKVAELEEGSFANRGYHFNSLVMPMWTKADNDQRCRQFARDVSDMFKKEIEEHGNRPSEGLEGGVGVRGKKGAVMLYGNYDVSVPRRVDEAGSSRPDSNTKRSLGISLGPTIPNCKSLRQNTIRRICLISCLRLLLRRLSYRSNLASYLEEPSLEAYLLESSRSCYSQP